MPMTCPPAATHVSPQTTGRSVLLAFQSEWRAIVPRPKLLSPTAYLVVLVRWQARNKQVDLLRLVARGAHTNEPALSWPP